MDSGEGGGATIQDLLCNKKPWAKEACSRESCTACSNKPGPCQKVNVTYRIDCNLCASQGIKAVYIGETHWACWDHLREHETAIWLKDSNYATVKHLE